MKNMLSKVIRAGETGKLGLRPYAAPSIEEIDRVLEQRTLDLKRRNFLEEYKHDPLAAARKEADLILINAQEKLKAAQMEAVALKTRQEKEIRALLEKEFQAKMDAELANIRKNSLEALTELAKLKEIVYYQNEEELMELAISITRKVIGDELKTSPQLIKGMLQRGFEKIKDGRQFEIKLNPFDYEVLSKEKGGLNELLKISGTIHFTKDENVERGGCKIIADSGVISSEPGKQLDIILKELLDET